METLTLVDFVILLLAAYRLSNLLADPYQAGPFNLLLKFRDRVGVYFDEFSQPSARTNFASGLLCEYCNSTWIGLVFTLVALALSLVNIPIWIVFSPLALSGFVVLIKELKDGV